MGEFTRSKSTLFVSKEKTNGYFDIPVKSKITKSINFEDENGDCDSKENSTITKTILKFDGKEYKETVKN